MADTNYSPIAEFYTEKSVLITGATGFIGKVLLEKLMRSCIAVKTIYILIRTKREVEPNQRLEELFKSKVFDRVKEEQPGSLSKVVAIQGDLRQPDLGLSQSDLCLLISNVSIVFHSAATVRFDEKLKNIMNINVLGTRRVFELSQKMNHLEAFVHLSTTYCYCEKKELDENIYDINVPPEKLIDSVEWMSNEMVEAITPQIISGLPTTYAFCKAVTENLLAQISSGYPIAIVRPSVVASSWKEPFPGWVDTLNGPSGLFIAAGKGILRSVYSKSSTIFDAIPVDVVVNLVIAVAWFTATHRSKNIQVYNCASSNVNPITFGVAEKIVTPLVDVYPSEQTVFYPNKNLRTSNKFWHWLRVLLFHKILGRLLDWGLILIRQKPILVEIYNRIENSTSILQYFALNEWIFKSDNVLNLIDQLSPQDRKEFNFDIRNLNWPSYLNDGIMGGRYFLLNEEPSSIPSARKKLKWVYLYTNLIHGILILFLLFLFFSLILSFSVIGILAGKSIICFLSGRMNLFLNIC